MFDVSKCFQSIWVCAALVLCLKYSCLFSSTFWTASTSFPFSAKPTFQKLVASLRQPWSLSKFLHRKKWCFTLCVLKKWCFTLCVLQSLSLNPNSVCLSEAVFRGYHTAVFISACISSPSVDNCPRCSHRRLDMGWYTYSYSPTNQLLYLP